MRIIKGKWLLILVSFFIFLAFFAPIFFLFQKRKEKPKFLPFETSPPDALPIHLNISNLYPYGFTVSWVSVEIDTNKQTFFPKKTTGKIILTENQPIDNENSGISIFDKRGENYRGTTHYIEVKNLKPETLYAFKIKSGPTIYSYKDDNWLKTGTPQDNFILKTPKVIGDETRPPSSQNPYGAYSLEPGAFLPCPDGTNNPPNTPCFRPNPILIDTKKGDVIVKVVVKDENGEIKSSFLSCLTEPSENLTGKCLIDLANFWKVDLSTYLAYQPDKDKLLFLADGGNQGFGTAEMPIPEVIADSCLVDSLRCQTPPRGETTISINLTVPPSPALTPTPTVTPVRRCNLLGDLNCDGKVNEADFSVIFQNWRD